MAHWNSAHVRHVYINYFLQFLSLSPLSATLPIYDEFLTESDSLSHLLEGDSQPILNSSLSDVFIAVFSYLSCHQNKSEDLWLCLLPVQLQCGHIEQGSPTFFTPRTGYGLEKNLEDQGGGLGMGCL